MKRLVALQSIVESDNRVSFSDRQNVSLSRMDSTIASAESLLTLSSRYSGTFGLVDCEVGALVVDETAMLKRRNASTPRPANPSQEEAVSSLAVVGLVGSVFLVVWIATSFSKGKRGTSWLTTTPMAHGI